MRNSHTLRRPIADKEYGTIRVFVFRDETYEDLVNKCKYFVFPEIVHNKDAEFFLCDASGNRIGNENLLMISADGTQESVPWSLSQYFRVRGVKYPSKVKFTVTVKLPPEQDAGIATICYTILLSMILCILPRSRRGHKGD